MKWIKASEKLPTKKGSVFVREINNPEKRTVKYFTPCKHHKSDLTAYLLKYEWLDEEEDEAQILFPYL